MKKLNMTVNLSRHALYYVQQRSGLFFDKLRCLSLQIRGTGVYLLKEYFPWPLILSENDSTGVLAARTRIRKALLLARSPRVQDCESAAVLFQLMYLRFVSTT